MTTVKGTIVDGNGDAVSAKVGFESLDTPLVLSGGVVVADSVVYVRSAVDGSFSIVLEAGNYLVTVYQGQKTVLSNFNINVPAGSSTMDIDDITTSSLVYTPPTAPAQLVDAGLLVDVLNTQANYRFKSGQMQFWDDAAYAADSTKPWRALGVQNGVVVWSEPIAN